MGTVHHQHTHGCGCGTFIIVMLVVGTISIGAEWAAKNPLPAALIGFGLAAVIVAVSYFWYVRNDVQTPAVPPRATSTQTRTLGEFPLVPPPSTPSPAKYCGYCGTRLSAGTGKRFCPSCGKPVTP